MQSRLMNWVAAGILCLSVSLFGGCNGQNQNSADTPIDTQAALSVNDAVRELKPDEIPRTVTGVVRTAEAEDRLLTLIDVEEYRTCGLSDCCLYLPVHWQGEMPKMKDLVTVQGTIKTTDSGMVFWANKLYVDENAATE